MKPIEILEAVTDLISQPFDPIEFPYSFLRAFDNSETTLRRLRSGATNQSDAGGVLQRNNIHIAVDDASSLSSKLNELRESSMTARQKAKFVLVTDGITVQAENLQTGDFLTCNYRDLDDKCTFFFQLAGISTVKEIRESSFDIRATGNLNKLYIELIKINPDWTAADRKNDLNKFLSRLIFCFFAENTGIFEKDAQFTDTVHQISSQDASDTHQVIQSIFEAMNVDYSQRDLTELPNWAKAFPYVNGGLFSGDCDVPIFNKIARTYLLHIGSLSWTKINPDIFGSMIQAVADESERSELGMHYTSVPNILKVIEPLFLSELKEELIAAGTNQSKLLNLRNRIAKIRIFDPACGSGNFLVIAYKELRQLEASINELLNEKGKKSAIPITNFRGIEYRGFSAEIARLALIIAEFQSNAEYRGQQDAVLDFLPLDDKNWITCGNALTLDWLSICPPTGQEIKYYSTDLFDTAEGQAEIDFENEDGETFICGNPPYVGSRVQTNQQKSDIRKLFNPHTNQYRVLDYVCCWFLKAAEYGKYTNAKTAFVTTNSICQGQHVPTLWPVILSTGSKIFFAYTSFKWSNLAKHNAGVTVSIIGLSDENNSKKFIFSTNKQGDIEKKECDNINPYLIPYKNVIIQKSSKPLFGQAHMAYGNYPGDSNFLSYTYTEKTALIDRRPDLAYLLRPVFGAQEFLKGKVRYCCWIDDDNLQQAMSDDEIKQRIEKVREHRLSSQDTSLNALADRPHQYRDRSTPKEYSILVPTISSEARRYIPADLKAKEALTTNQSFALYDADLWNLALISSRLHLIWTFTACGQHETRPRYSNTMGWNTFPIPILTKQQKRTLSDSAKDILLAREQHYPATLAELYDPEKMPMNLKNAHATNDEIIERIYIGRQFKNDTERLEKLFALYTKMQTQV